MKPLLIITTILFPLIGGAQTSIDYSYDAAGNRTSRETVASLTAMVSRRACHFQESFSQNALADALGCSKENMKYYGGHVKDYSFEGPALGTIHVDSVTKLSRFIIVNPNNFRRKNHEEEI